MTAPEAERAVQEFVAATARHDDSTHDLLRDLLAYCAGSTVAFESIYAAANAKLPQDRAGVRSVLTAFPYFVMAEPDRWLFDAEMHRKVLTALAERELSELPGLFGGAPRENLLQPKEHTALRAHVTGGTAQSPAAAVKVSAPEFAATISGTLKESMAKSDPPAAHSRKRTTGGRVPVENSEEKPASTRDKAIKLLSLDPDVVCDVLRRLVEGKPLPSGIAFMMAILSELGWCRNKGNGYEVTAKGRAIPVPERANTARRLEAELRLLPAYQAAEQQLRQSGSLDAPKLMEALRALPPAFHVAPGALLMWLGWIVRQRGLGAASASRVSIRPDKRQLL